MLINNDFFKKQLLAGYLAHKKILVQKLTPFEKGRPLKDVIQETKISETDIINTLTNIREPPNIVIYTVEKDSGKEEKWIKIGDT